MEAVRPDSSMSGQQQQQQSTSGVGRHRCDDKNHLKAGSSVPKGEEKLECQQCDKTFENKSQLKGGQNSWNGKMRSKNTFFVFYIFS